MQLLNSFYLNELNNQTHTVFVLCVYVCVYVVYLCISVCVDGCVVCVIEREKAKKKEISKERVFVCVLVC